MASSRGDDIVIHLSRAEAAALARVAELGLRAAEAFQLIQSTAMAERAIARVNAAIGAGTSGR